MALIRRASYPPDLIVYKTDSTYYAHVMSDGTAYSGSSLSTVAQAGLDYLTSGRTHKETALFKGDLTLDAIVNVPSYTHVVIDGKVTLAASASISAMFRNKNFGTSLDTDIEITGGEIDGNEANGASGHCVWLDGVTDSSVHDIVVNNAGGASGRNIYITTTAAARTSERVHVHHIDTDNATNSNLEVAGNTVGDTRLVQQVQIDHIISTNAGQRNIIFANVRDSTLDNFICDTAGSHNLDLSYNSIGNQISNGICIDATNDGVECNSLTSSDNSFTNVRVYSATDQGFATSATDLTFTNCRAESCGQAGFRMSTGSDRFKLKNCTAKNNGQTTANTYNGVFVVASDSGIIEGGHFIDDQGTATQKYGVAIDPNSDNTHVYGNTFSGNASGAIQDTSTTSNIHDNVGHSNVTDNSAVAVPSILERTGTEIADIGVVTGQVSHYTLASNGNDSVGSNNLTEFGTPTHSAGKIGLGVVGNGSSQYLQAADNTVHNFTTGSFSFTFWFKRTTDSGAEEDLIRKREGATTAGYVIGIDSTDRLFGNFNDDSGGSSISASVTGVIATDSIYFGAVVFDRTNDLITVYRFDADGNEATATADISSKTGSATNTQTFTLLRSSISATSYFAGMMDDLYVYNTALTSAEIARKRQESLMNIYACTEAGSGFSAGEFYVRNLEQTAMKQITIA